MSAPGRRGRGRLGALWLVLPLAFLVGFSLRALRQGTGDGFRGERLSDAEAAGVPEVHAGAEVDGFAGAGTLEDARVEVRLAPLEPAPAAQAFVAESWGRRLGLPAGEPWRLDVALVDGEQALDLRDLSVEDDAGVALHRPAVVGGGRDPRAVLLRPREQPLATGQRRELLLWGRPPAGSPRLNVGRSDGETLVLELRAAHFAPGDLPRWLAAPSVQTDGVATALPPDEGLGGAAAKDADEVPAGGDVGGSPREDAAREPSAGERDEQDPLGALDAPALRERVAALEDELGRLRQRRAERELAWYEYNRALAALDVDALVAAFDVDEELLRGEGLVADEDAGAEDAEGPDDARTERDVELERGVRTLLSLEGFSGLDLLELGPALDGGGAGPAVFRMLDDRGRLIGSLNARRLRLEASRSARTITLVLEDGFESRNGERVPFSGGERRLLIPYVDPDPYVDALPELFPPELLAPARDDGTWDLEPLRRELNRLLALDTSAGWWRVHGLGGVTGAVLRDVQLEQLGDDGGARRRVFADRLRILAEEPGVLLVLEDGAIVRGQEKTPFVDGSYRLFLPRAPLAAWRAADVPLVPAGDAVDEAVDDAGGPAR